MNHVQDIRKKVELMCTDQKCVILDINTQDYEWFKNGDYNHFEEFCLNEMWLILRTLD